MKSSGHEYEKDKYIVITDEILKNCPLSQKLISISFVDEDESTRYTPTRLLHFARDFSASKRSSFSGHAKPARSALRKSR